MKFIHKSFCSEEIECKVVDVAHVVNILRAHPTYSVNSHAYEIRIWYRVL